MFEMGVSVVDVLMCLGCVCNNKCFWILKKFPYLLTIGITIPVTGGFGIKILHVMMPGHDHPVPSTSSGPFAANALPPTH